MWQSVSPAPGIKQLPPLVEIVV